VSTIRIHFAAFIAALKAAIWRYRHEVEQLKKPLPF